MPASAAAARISVSSCVLHDEGVAPRRRISWLASGDESDPGTFDKRLGAGGGILLGRIAGCPGISFMTGQPVQRLMHGNMIQR